MLEQAARDQTAEGRGPGLLAYAGHEVVGWVSVGPREDYERLAHSRSLYPVDDTPVWSIVCFVVGRKARGQGVAARLLDAAIDYAREDFVARVKQETGGRGADVIYDSVGGDVFEGSLKCIAWNGRLVVIGFAGGTIPSVKANRILLKNIEVTGLHWGAYAQHQPASIPEVFAALFALYEAGKIRPLVFRAYPLEDAGLALAELGSRSTWGKVVLAP